MPQLKREKAGLLLCLLEENLPREKDWVITELLKKMLVELEKGLKR